MTYFHIYTIMSRNISAQSLQILLCLFCTSFSLTLSAGSYAEGINPNIPNQSMMLKSKVCHIMHFSLTTPVQSFHGNDKKIKETGEILQGLKIAQYLRLFQIICV